MIRVELPPTTACLRYDTLRANWPGDLPPTVKPTRRITTVRWSMLPRPVTRDVWGARS